MKGKIVLFFPNPFSAQRPYNGAPVGLLGISRVLDAEGYDIKIIHPQSHKKYEQDILAECDGAVCFGVSSMTGYQISEGIQAAKHVRERYPHLPIVWGGWHPSILPLETIQNEYVDIIVKGQGERTFPELVHCLERGGNLREIAGITFKENGMAVDNPSRRLESLDNFPPLPYHLIDVEKFIVNEDYGSRTLLYYTSYGCPHRCGFCVEEIVNKRQWVSLSAERIVDEIEDMHKKYRIDAVVITDTNFFVNKDRVRKMCEIMIVRGLKIRWGGVNGRTTTLVKYEEPLWDLMERAGIATFLIGAESGNQDTLDYMMKDINVDDVYEVARICKKHHVSILASYLAGFPWSSNPRECVRKVDEEIAVTLKQIRKLYSINESIRPMFYLYLPYPSTALFDKAKNLGIDLPTNLEAWSDFVIAATGKLTTKKVQRWIKPRQARLLHVLTTYIFFFLAPTSWQVYGNRIKNPVIRALGFVGFHFFKAIVLLRWKANFFSLALDYRIYSYMRARSQIG